MAEITNEPITPRRVSSGILHCPAILYSKSYNVEWQKKKKKKTNNEKKAREKSSPTVKIRINKRVSNP